MNSTPCSSTWSRRTPGPAVDATGHGQILPVTLSTVRLLHEPLIRYCGERL